MKKCLIVINNMSGRSAKIDETKLREKFSAAYDVSVVRITEQDDVWSPCGYDLVVACGGDGTFNHALNACAECGVNLIYYGFGTFNECAKAKGTRHGESEFIRLYEYAEANDRYFGYVAAAGSFTPLGYVVDIRKKQKMGVLAYLLEVVKQYKVYRIPAEIEADGETFKGDYTLIMAIDSMRCFGFRFNRLYRADDGKVHLLLVKSPRVRGLLGKIAIFFPLFRAFFMGFGKEVHGDKLVFKSVSDLKIKLFAPETFDVDGDAVNFAGDVFIRVRKPANEVYIGDFDRMN